MKKVIALIPARGGSKGIPRKNIKILAGKPLLVHSIEQARSAPQISETYVSTDDDTIARIARDAGAAIIKRPDSLSGDNATTESAVEHALSFLDTQGIIPDVIVLLQATSPLRPVNAASDAIDVFLSGNYDSLLSLSPTHRFFWHVLPDGYAEAEYDFMSRPKRQDIKPHEIRYVENGSLYIFSRIHFQKTGNRLGGKIGYIVFPEEYSHEMDSPADFAVIDALFNHQESIH